MEEYGEKYHLLVIRFLLVYNDFAQQTTNNNGIPRLS